MVDASETSGPTDAARPLVLASRSPQRRAILAQLGIDFTVEAVEVEEICTGEPRALAVENALRKARAVAARRPRSLVLGVDTVVALDGEPFGKPADDDAARTVLRRLSGRDHTVWSGLALVRGDTEDVAAGRTTVTFRSLAAAQIDWYVATGEWRERAGGYAIQGRGAALVAGIDGDYLNVVGLPAVTLLELAPGLLGLR